MRSRFWLPISIVMWSAGLVALALATASSHRITGYPFTDDAFYSLSVARQLATGHGITIDGSTPTNGFQPLWVFLISPIYWWTSGARVPPLRGVLACAALIWIATAWILARLAASVRIAERGPIVTWVLLLYLTSPAIFEQHFNGLETGLLLLTFAAIARLAAVPDWSRTRTVLIALVCGLLVLARIDTAFFVALLAAVVFCFPRSDALAMRFERAIVIGAGAALVSAPWWLYNLRVFGRLLPSSGSATFDWHWKPGRALVLSMTSAANALPLPIRSLWPWSWHYEWCAAALLVVGAALILRRSPRIVVKEALATLDQQPIARVVLALTLYTLVIIVAYALSRAWWMYDRYTSPVFLLSAPVLGVLLARVAGDWRVLSVAAVAAVLVFVVTVRAKVQSPLNNAFQAQVSLANKDVPPDDRVGALQSGTLGYFRDHVVNLDGKVNAAALADFGHLDDYASRIDLEWIVDWPRLLSSSFVLDRWQLVEQVDDPLCGGCSFALYRRRLTALPASR